MSSDSSISAKKVGFSAVSVDVSPQVIKPKAHGKFEGHDVSSEVPDTADAIAHETLPNSIPSDEQRVNFKATKDPSPKAKLLDRRISSSNLVKRMSSSNLGSKSINRTNNEEIAQGNPKPIENAELPAEKTKISLGLSNLSQEQKHTIEEAMYAPRAHQEMERTVKSTQSEQPTNNNSQINTDKKSSFFQNIMGGGRKSKIANDSSLSAEEGKMLIYQGASGKPISSDEYLKAADKIATSPNRSPEDSTVMHLLYEKAAVGFLKEGEISNAFNARAASAKAVQFSESHQLHNMAKGIQEGCAKQPIPDVGLHMDSGSSRMAEAIAFATRPDSKGNDKSVLFCQLTPASRKEFAEKFEQIFGTVNPETKEFSNSNIKKFEKSLPAHLKPVKITYLKGGNKEPFVLQGKDDKGKFTSDPSRGLSIDTASFEIEFGKGAKLVMGAAPNMKTIYESIKLEVPSGQPDGNELKQMQQILAVMGLGPVMGAQLPTDDERAKLGLMLKSHFPQAWDRIQEDPNYHDYSPAQLQQKMIEIEPRMVEKFEMYKNNPLLVEKRQIFPGKEVYALNDISQEMEKAGIQGFFTGTGVKGAAAFLRSGITSSDLKKRAMITSTAGASELVDMMTGGSSSIFLRAFNDKLSQVPISSDKFAFSSDYQVIYKTSVINIGGICYHNDQYGIRNTHYKKQKETFQTYAYRQSPVDFAKNLDKAIDKFPVNNLALGTYDYEVYEGDDVIDEQGKLILSKGDVLYSGEDEDRPHNVEDRKAGDKTYKVIFDPTDGASNEATIEGGNISPEFVSAIHTGSLEKKQILLQELEQNGMLSDIQKDANGLITEANVTYNDGPGQKAIQVSVNDLVIVRDFLSSQNI